MKQQILITCGNLQTSTLINYGNMRKLQGYVADNKLYYGDTLPLTMVNVEHDVHLPTLLVTWKGNGEELDKSVDLKRELEKLIKLTRTDCVMLLEDDEAMFTVYEDGLEFEDVQGVHLVEADKAKALENHTGTYFYQVLTNKHFYFLVK